MPLAEIILRGQSLVSLVVTIIVLGLIYWLLLYLIGAIPVPEPFAKVARIILLVAAVLILINALLTVAGHPLVVW